MRVKRDSTEQPLSTTSTAQTDPGQMTDDQMPLNVQLTEYK